MKYDQQVREAFMGIFRDAFILGLGDAKAEFPEEEFEELFQEIVRDMGGFEQMDRDIDRGVEKGHSVEEQLSLLKDILNRMARIKEIE